LVRRSGIFGTCGFKKGIKVDLKKAKTITKCPKLTNVIENRYFLGVAGYYRVSKRIYQRSSSLTNLLKEATKLARR